MEPIDPQVVENSLEDCTRHQDQFARTANSFHNGKSISPIDSALPTTAHDTDTDSDLARPPDGSHSSAPHATPGMLLQSASHQRTAGHVVAHPGSCDSE
jgi:hypothetical protein